jgi:hypothetical protein
MQSQLHEKLKRAKSKVEMELQVQKKSKVEAQLQAEKTSLHQSLQEAVRQRLASPQQQPNVPAKLLFFQMLLGLNKKRYT